jgi:hypothetical protein
MSVSPSVCRSVCAVSPPSLWVFCFAISRRAAQANMLTADTSTAKLMNSTSFAAGPIDSSPSTASTIDEAVAPRCVNSTVFGKSPINAQQTKHTVLTCANPTRSVAEMGKSDGRPWTHRCQCAEPVIFYRHRCIR